MKTTEQVWVPFSLVGPIETHQYRTNLDASVIQYWANSSIPGLCKRGWNRTTCRVPSILAAKALKEAQEAK